MAAIPAITLDWMSASTFNSGACMPAGSIGSVNVGEHTTNPMKMINAGIPHDVPGSLAVVHDCYDPCRQTRRAASASTGQHAPNANTCSILAYQQLYKTS